MTTPSALSKVASQLFLDAQPPLLFQEGTTSLFPPGSATIDTAIRLSDTPVMKFIPRREFIGGLAAAGASALLPQAQGRTGKINIHHHLTAPAYVKFLMDNKVRDFPNRSVAEGIEDMDKAGISTAFTSIIGPGIW